MDKFVRPEGKVIDLNEKYSGIQHRHIDPKQNKKCVKDLKEARSMVRAIVSEDCYLLGHSLESDLCTLNSCVHLLLRKRCVHIWPERAKAFPGLWLVNWSLTYVIV